MSKVRWDPPIIKMRIVKCDFKPCCKVCHVVKMVIFFLIFSTLFGQGPAAYVSDELDNLTNQKYYWFTYGEGDRCPTEFLSDLEKNPGPGAKKLIQLGKVTLKHLFNETGVPDPEDVLPFELHGVLSEADEKKLGDTIPQHEKDRNLQLRSKLKEWKKAKMEREKKRVDKFNSMVCLILLLYTAINSIGKLYIKNALIILRSQVQGRRVMHQRRTCTSAKTSRRKK